MKKDIACFPKYFTYLLLYIYTYTRIQAIIDLLYVAYNVFRTSIYWIYLLSSMIIFILATFSHFNLYYKSKQKKDSPSMCRLITVTGR